MPIRIFIITDLPFTLLTRGTSSFPLYVIINSMPKISKKMLIYIVSGGLITSTCPGILITSWVDFWRWIFVRNAVKCGEKKNFHRVFLTSFSGECGESRWIIYFHRVLSIHIKKSRPNTRSDLWTTAWLQLLSPLRQLSLTSFKFHLILNQIE